MNSQQVNKYIFKQKLQEFQLDQSNVKLIICSSNYDEPLL